MTSIQASGPRPAEPMRGPDFLMQKVASWVERPGADSQLVLADGSHWHLDPQRADYAAQVASIALALKADEPVLVSGSQARGDVDRIGDTRKLAAHQVADYAVDGLVVVTCHGPPSIYRVRLARPGAEHDLALLRRSVTSGAFFDTPDLLVGIDTRAKEVVAVRPLADAPASAHRALSGRPLSR
ncbi:MAG: hypothetical protein ABJD97_16760 [Betaproteobacteria bacterium]